MNIEANDVIDALVAQIGELSKQLAMQTALIKGYSAPTEQADESLDEF